MNNQFLYITLLLCILIALIFIYFFVSIIRYHRRYIELQKERTNAEITIQENERKRIANDLHDSFGPVLSAVKMNINCIETHTPEDEEIIQKSSAYIDDVIMNLRRISHNLLPNTLERKGVIEALKEFIQDLHSKSKLQIQVTVSPEVTIPSEKGIHIFRILQEIIHNTIKHAQASHLQIDIDKKRDHVLIVTKDDGVGFNEEAVKKESGLGLKSITSRVELLNGKITLETAPEKGTVYYIKIPV